MGTRDDMCGIDVARMAELGGFAEEITIIGCVYKQDGDVLYRVTDDPDEAYHFYESAARQGILPTLPQIYVRREIIPAGQRERMTDEAKLTCARQMCDAFDSRFWQCFDALAATPAENSAALPKVRRQFQDWLKETVQQLAVPFEEAINEGACSQTPFGEDDLTDLSAPAQTTLRYYQIFWGLE